MAAAAISGVAAAVIAAGGGSRTPPRRFSAPAGTGLGYFDLDSDEFEGSEPAEDDVTELLHGAAAELQALSQQQKQHKQVVQ